MNKVLERLVAMRNKETVLKPGFASNQQCRYRKQKGAEQAIKTLCRMADEMEKDIVMPIFFDVTGAFDHLR